MNPLITPYLFCPVILKIPLTSKRNISRLTTAVLLKHGQGEDGQVLVSDLFIHHSFPSPISHVNVSLGILSSDSIQRNDN